MASTCRQPRWRNLPQAQVDGSAGANARRAVGADDGAAPRPATSRLSGGGLVQGDIFRMRWSLGDPDKFMDRTIPYLRFFFTRGFLIVSVVALRDLSPDPRRQVAGFLHALATCIASALGRQARASSGSPAPGSSPSTSWGTATPASISAARCTRSARCCSTSSPRSSAT